MTQQPGPREIAAGWEPQVPGRRAARDITDALVEPDWGGMRVVAALTVDDVALFAAGEEIPVPEELAEALRDGFRAVEAVVEGNLTTKALETGEGVMPARPQAERPALVIPRGLRRSLREDPYLRAHEHTKEALAARPAVLEALEEGERHAFVATDLLWLDGQPLVDIPLLERKRVLETVFLEGELVRVTAFVQASALATLVTWGVLGFHDLFYRAANSRYLRGRENPDWAVVTPPRPSGSVVAPSTPR